MTMFFSINAATWAASAPTGTPDLVKQPPLRLLPESKHHRHQSAAIPERRQSLMLPSWF